MWGTLDHGVLECLQGRFIPTHVGNSFRVRPLAFISSVHPHACGELKTITIRGSNRDGSSPRMWGTQIIGDSTLQNMRFIPTHVGNSFLLVMPMAGQPVHPHACGELSDCIPGNGDSVGSSPRMWGTLFLELYEIT